MPLKTSSIPELPNQWRKLSSTAVRERGIDYFLRQRAIAQPSTADSDLPCFTVIGSTPYWVELNVESPGESSCTCPHAESVLICKHMIASYLSWASTQTHTSAPSSTAGLQMQGARSSRPDALNEMQADITFLQSQPRSALQDWIAEQCDQNPEIAVQLRLWRQKATSKHTPMTPAQWRSFLTQAMPQKRGLYGRELRRWADNAMRALQPWEEMLDAQADNLRVACTLALRRLYKLWETADDSNGELYELHAWLQNMLQRSVHTAPPPASWLKDWLILLQEDPLGNWDEDALLSHAGEDLQRAYCRHAVTQWEAWCKANPHRIVSHWRPSHDTPWEQIWQRYLLRKRYLWAMEQSMDIHALIALMRETAQTEDDWLDAFRFCERHHRHREALSIAEQAVAQFPSDLRLKNALLSCYMRDGWEEEALTLAQELALKQPHDNQQLALYLQCAVALGHTRQTAQDALIEKMWDLAQPANDLQQGLQKDMSDAIRWLLQDNDWARALAIAQRPSTFCTPHTLCQLAVRLPPSHSAEAAHILQGLFDQEMRSASSPYRDALHLVKLAVTRLPTAVAHQWLQTLQTTYKAKRRFLEGLQTIQVSTTMK